MDENENNNEEQGQMSPEQAADFARLHAGAEEVESSLQAQQEEQEQQQAQSLYEENVEAIKMLFGFGRPVFDLVGYPTVAIVLDDAQIDMLATSWAAVATKYGYSMKSFGFAYKEELAAAFATYQVGKIVIAAIKHDIEQRAKKEKEPKEQEGAVEVKPETEEGQVFG